MSEHSEEAVAAKLVEPENGTILVVANGSYGADPYRVIWRDDAEAKRWGGHETERWFRDPDSDPMALYQHVKYAQFVYEVGRVVASF